MIQSISKEKLVISWIQKIRNYSSDVMISNYCYECTFSNKHKTKTLIVFPHEIEKNGVITIDKPLEEIEIFDIIKLYKKIKCN